MITKRNKKKKNPNFAVFSPSTKLQANISLHTLIISSAQQCEHVQVKSLYKSKLIVLKRGGGCLTCMEIAEKEY